MAIDPSLQGREVEVMTGLVNCLVDVHTPLDALMVLDKLLEVDPAQHEARELRRRIQMWSYDQDSKINKPILALKVQSTLAKADPDLDPKSRLDIAEAALAMNPYHHKANELLAEAARRLGWGPVVELAYETLCYRYPNNRAYAMELARVYQLHGELEKARRIYQDMLDEDPDDLEADEALMRIEHEMEQDRAAGQIKGKDIAEVPDDRTVTELEKQLKELEGEQESLREEMNRMAQIDDSTRQMMAEVVNRVDMAHLDLLEAEALRHPEDMEIVYHLGQAREKVGLFGEAYEAYDQLLLGSNAVEEAMVCLTRCLVSRGYQQYAYGVPQEGTEDEVQGHDARLSEPLPILDTTTTLSLRS